MRSFGILLIVIGGFIIYLGWQGKMGPAFYALLGKGVNLSSAPSGIGGNYKTSPGLGDNPSGNPGGGSMYAPGGMPIPAI